MPATPKILQQSLFNAELVGENDDIGQYLCLSLSNTAQIKMEPMASDTQQPVLNTPSKITKLTPKRSPFHNFQKHFVTTLRRNVRIEWPEIQQSHVAAAKEIWTIFQASKKYTNEFVYQVLGQTHAKIDLEVLEKYKLLSSYLKYGAPDFIKAQNMLKQNVLRTFRQIPSEKVMYERRIAKKEQFANYLQKVLKEIEDGSKRKRMSKQRNH